MQVLGPLVFNIIAFSVFFAYSLRNKKKGREIALYAFGFFKRVFPLILVILMLVSLIQALVSLEKLPGLVSQVSGVRGYLVSGLVGSLLHIPHIVVFPIGGELLAGGVNPGVIAVFITTLVTVHTLSMPLEIKELGLRFSLMRNLLTFAFALIIGVLIGVFY